MKWYTVPEAMDFDGWDAWRADVRRRHPVQYFFRETARTTLAIWHRQFIHEPWYWLKCRLWHRYNVVVCRSLPPTWCDRDYLLLHAAFQILTDFIEKEEPWEFAATPDELRESYSEDRMRDWERIRLLYRWWKVRVKEDDWADVDAQRKEDNAMLHRLVNLRGYFWT